MPSCAPSPPKAAAMSRSSARLACMAACVLAASGAAPAIDAGRPREGPYGTGVGMAAELPGETKSHMPSSGPHGLLAVCWR